ncbi:MAG: polysaccharide deacetylase family protein [Polyangiaceae bacterium]
MGSRATGLTTGVLTISLDFELFWGMRDHRTLDACRENLLGVRRAVPEILRVFKAHEIHATWATVGFLFFGGRGELEAGLPARLPEYENRELDPYREVGALGDSEEADPLHFAPSLLKQVAEQPGQEIGTHTMSHYYCLEPGQTIEAFRADLLAAAKVAERQGIALKSLVFPRNQFNERYLSVCREMGITAYRGNQASWVYEPRNQGERACFGGGSALDGLNEPDRAPRARHAEDPARRAVRCAGRRFLRPWSLRLAPLDPPAVEAGSAMT